MKKLLLFLCLVLSIHAGYAQPSLSSRMTTSRSLNRQFYLWDTGFRRIFVMKHFRMLDSLCLYDSLLNASISGTVGSLATVTGIGNTTTTLMKVYNSSFGYEASHAYNGYFVSTYPLSDQRVFLGVSGGLSQLKLRDGAGYYGTYYPSTFTADRAHYAPDEDGTFVTHVTKDSVVVGSMSTANATITTGAFKVRSGSSIYAQLNSSVGSGYVDLKDGSSSYKVSIWGSPFTGSLTADRNYYPPNASGTWALRRDTIGDGVSDFPKLVTEAYLNSWTGGGASISNSALRWNGNYIQHVAKKSIYFDSTFSYKIQDTSANQLLNLNDTSLYTTSMIYASSRSDKTARMRTPNGLSEMFVIGNATSNLARLKGGDNTINLSQSNAVCNINLICGSGGNVTLVLDSISQGIKIRPKIVEYNSVSTVGYGVPAIYGTGRATAQTAANPSVATYTLGAADGSFEVSANVNVTVSSGENFTVTCAYRDETNTARTLTLPFIKIAGTFAASITSATGAAPYHGQTLAIRCKAGTTITIATTGTFTGCTYNVEGTIKQIN